MGFSAPAPATTMLFGRGVMYFNCPDFGYQIGTEPLFLGGYDAGCLVKGANVRRYKKLQKRLLHRIYGQLYRDTNRTTRNSILVAGTARSGTTWLGSIIASQVPCRMMFEPFNSGKVEDFRQFYYFQYMRPTDVNSALQSYCQTIFTGNIRNGWIDREIDNLKPRYRLIKEIRVNLFLKWISLAFPEIPLLFIIRHPCAVALSRMQLDWATDSDIEPFLAQPKLIDDFLADKLDIIKSAKTDEEKHAIIWCISNLVPLKQFGPKELNVIFYENLVLQPEIEIPRIFQVINLPYENTVFAQANKPSTTTIRSSAIVTGDNKVTRWKRNLSAKQIDNILSIVEAFGLDYLYSGFGTPLTQN